MPIFRIPKTIRWILSCGFLFLILMSLYRISIFLFFDYYDIGGKQMLDIFFMGVRFDLRVVSVFTLGMLLLSFWPHTHFFKTDIGRYTAFFCYFLFIVGLIVFYAADMVSLFVFKNRLNGTLISDLVKSTPKGLLYKQGAPWTIIFLSTIVASWLLLLIVKWQHTRINRRSVSTDRKPIRVVWQIIALLLCIFFIYGTIGKRPLSTGLISGKLPVGSVQLSINPLESFFATLPQAN